MNEIKNKQSTVLTNLSDLRESILENFLLIADSLNKDLTLLLEAGIDERRFTCLQGTEVEKPFCYTFLNRKMVEDFQKTLLRITKNEKDVILKFRSLTTGRYNKLYCEYAETQELITLANAYHEAVKAEELIKAIL